MKLAILGGGGFRTPLVHGAILGDTHDRRVDEVWLHDVEESRLDVIARVLEERAAPVETAPTVHATTTLDEALEGADFVFSAIRTGGLAARVADERVALDLGVLGQETTGPGGISYGLRTVPVALHVAERVRALAPEAWVINFTNPAGMITEAMQSVLGDRAVGICDTPIAMAKRAARVVGTTPDPGGIDYVGLNHLGWLRALRCNGSDVLPDLLADDALLASTEEGQLFGLDWLRALGMLPNEYLHYYYANRETVAAIRAARQTRGEFLLAQQDSFYRSCRDADNPYAVWDAVRLERNATYMAESRAEGEERDELDIEGGGYEGVALALMAAIARDEPAELILNVRNGSDDSLTVPGLSADAVVEAPCRVAAAGIRALPVSPLTGSELGLAQQVKAVDRLVIHASTTGDETAAWKAFALHPLVDSVEVGRQLLAGYRATIPAIDALFPRLST